MEWKANLYINILGLFFHSLPVSSDFSCPGPGFYPDPSSCTTFYRCLDRVTSFQFLCPAGTRYDQVLGMCNHSELVTCNLKSEEGQAASVGQDASGGQAASGGQEATGGQAPSEDMTGSPGSSSPTNDNSQNIIESITSSSPKPPTTKPPRFEVRPTPARPDSAAESEVNIPDIINPVFPPSSPTESPSSVTEPPYTVSPTSIYPCTQPGYYEEVTSCKEFYVCREVGPGILSADRLFRCPDRYLFDIKTHLCQRKHKVTCEVQPNLFYTTLNYLVVQLEEEQLDQFFKQSLTLPQPRGRTGINQELSNIKHGPYGLPLLYSFPSYPHVILYH